MRSGLTRDKPRDAISFIKIMELCIGTWQNNALRLLIVYHSIHAIMGFMLFNTIMI